MKLRIGRFGVDFLSGEVRSVGDDGRVVSVAGVTAYAGRAEAESLRQQLLGYVNSTDEPFVPVLWDEQPELTGFYRAVSASMNERDGSAWEGLWDFTVELERVTGFAAPLIELRTLGTVRVNTHSATPSYAICVPGEAKSVGFFATDSGVWIPFSPDVTRESASGDVSVYRHPPTNPYLTQFFLPPARHYDGAATLMMGDDLSPVVGRQVRNLSLSWRLSNGLLEIEPASESVFGLQMRMWVGGWSEWVPFTIFCSEGIASRAPMLPPHSITVLRNRPEEVAVRLLATANGQYSPVTVDLALQRGSRAAAVEVSSVFTSRFGVSCADFAGATNTSYYWWKTLGVRRMVMTGPQDLGQTGDVVHPYEDAVTSVEHWSFGIGMAPESGGSDDNAAAAAGEYFWSGSPRQAVVVQ